MEALAAIGWVDWALLAALTLSVVVGLWRGVVYEVMSLLGWIVAYVAAQAFSPEVSTHLSVGRPEGALRIGAAFVLTFFVVLLAWSMLAWLVRRLVQATPLTIPDHLLGGVFGAFRGLCLLLVVATLVAFTPASEAAAWKHSHGAAWLAVVLQGLRPVLPDAVAQYLPE